MSASASPTPGGVRRLTVTDIARMHADGERIAMLTAYDYPTAKLLDEAGIPMLLVGDSLGRAMLGYENELSVSMDDMLHHAAAVTRGARRALVVGDMPFLHYASPEDAAPQRRPRSSTRPASRRSRSRAACAAPRTIEALVKAGIPVMGHIGLTPAVGQRDRQVPRPGQERRAGPRAAPRRARRPGGRRVLGRAGARPGAARRGDHGAPADPDHRDRRRAPAAAARSR